MSVKQRLATDIAGFAADPYGHALYAYPWGEGALADINGPRQWQGEILREVGEHLSNPATRHQPCRIAVASGHGIGKSALIAMISKWAIDTMPDTRVVITANTEQQLTTKTSPEVVKWHRMAVTKDWFKLATMKISSSQKGHEDNWRLDFATWSETNTEAFAGLHNAGRRIVIIFDEASRINDEVWSVTQGALSDEGTEILWLAFGNPTRNVGRFKDCFSRHRNLWRTCHIDSRTVEGTNKVQLQEIIDTYGEDSDFAKVRVRGLFPSASSMQFIGTELVDAARKLGRTTEVLSHPTDPVVFGLDHARFGDDSSVLAIRQGRDARSRPWQRWNGANSMEIAGDVAHAAGRWNPAAIFVDAGGPNAGGVIDRLRQLISIPVYEIPFGMKGREARFNGEIRVATANRRAEMWTNMRAWLERGAIPADNQALADDLTNVEYTYDRNNAILLEKKTHMRSRGLPSTDEADALALTFAEDVAPQYDGELGKWIPLSQRGVERDSDPYAELYACSRMIFFAALFRRRRFSHCQIPTKYAAFSKTKKRWRPKRFFASKARIFCS